MKRLLSNVGGLQTWVDIGPEETHVTKTQDIQKALEHNKAAAIHNGKNIRSNAYNHAGFIPTIIISKWLHEEGLNIYNPEHAARFRQKLNDPEYRFLRTSELKL